MGCDLGCQSFEPEDLEQRFTKIFEKETIELIEYQENDGELKEKARKIGRPYRKTLDELDEEFFPSKLWDSQFLDAILYHGCQLKEMNSDHFALILERLGQTPIYNMQSARWSQEDRFHLSISQQYLQNIFYNPRTKLGKILGFSQGVFATHNLRLLDFFVPPRDRKRTELAEGLWNILVERNSEQQVRLVTVYQTLEFFVTVALEAGYYPELSSVSPSDEDFAQMFYQNQELRLLRGERSPVLIKFYTDFAGEVDKLCAPGRPGKAKPFKNTDVQVSCDLYQNAKEAIAGMGKEDFAQLVDMSPNEPDEEFKDAFEALRNSEKQNDLLEKRIISKELFIELFQEKYLRPQRLREHLFGIEETLNSK